jgi:hypothetical protein
MHQDSKTVAHSALKKLIKFANGTIAPEKHTAFYRECGTARIRKVLRISANIFSGMA